MEVVGYADVDFATLDSVDLSRALVRRETLAIDPRSQASLEGWRPRRLGSGCLGILEVGAGRRPGAPV